MFDLQTYRLMLLFTWLLATCHGTAFAQSHLPSKPRSLTAPPLADVKLSEPQPVASISGQHTAAFGYASDPAVATTLVAGVGHVTLLPPVTDSKPNKPAQLVSDGSKWADLALPPAIADPVGVNSQNTEQPAPVTSPSQVRSLPPPQDSAVVPPTIRPPDTRSPIERSPVATANPQNNALDAIPSSLFEGIPKPTGVPGATQDLLLPGTNELPAPPPSPNRSADAAAPVEAARSQSVGPTFYGSLGTIQGPRVDAAARQVPYRPDSFLPQPSPPIFSDSGWERSVYDGKFAVPTQRPWVELGRPLYTGSIYPPAKDWFGKYNLVMPHFMVYGDLRTGAAVNRNAAGDANSLATRLNLEMDLEITATERLHALVGPFDRAGDFTRLDFTDNFDFVDRTDLRFDTLFFEGDAGAILGGLTDQDAPFDLPFSFGFLPLFYQNGIWAADNVLGAAFALPSKNSPWLKWSNYDATFFWASDQINSDAFPADNNAAEFFGTAWFIDAYDGYIEADYAFVHDDAGQHRSYHNFSVAFTRRYFQRLSNSVRYITNFNQSLPRDQRTADGHLILIENSLISAYPNTFVPYLNFFYGQGRTQSLARAGVAGGILNNSGINFETDGLTGYPTLDATGVNSTGAALGVNMLGCNFSHQLILEFAALAANGSPQFRNAPGDQYAIGLRYQKPINNAWIFRTDHMYGWRRNAEDLRGSRVELRWKF